MLKFSTRQFKLSLSRTGEPELGARELGFFQGARAGAGAIKIFGSSISYPVIEEM